MFRVPIPRTGSLVPLLFCRKDNRENISQKLDLNDKFDGEMSAHSSGHVVWEREGETCLWSGALFNKKGKTNAWSLVRRGKPHCVYSGTHVARRVRRLVHTKRILAHFYVVTVTVCKSSVRDTTLKIEAVFVRT